MQALRNKSCKLSKFARDLIQTKLADKVTIVTPAATEHHGAQLSLKFHHTDTYELVKQLKNQDIICDYRYPDIIRVAPVAFYNRYEDIFHFVQALERLL